jgi:KDO2-lipid IV(A) lauroyltransferase
VRETLSYRAYAAVWGVVRRLPERVAYPLFQLVADAVWRSRRGAVAGLERNLRRVRPDADEAELRALSREGMRSYLRYWCDAFRLADWSLDRTVSTVRCDHEERLRGPLAEGRGVIAALAHMGNWDHAGAWAARTGAPVVTVAERLRPERLYERFLAYRADLGIEILPLTGGGTDLVRTLTGHLREGRLVPLLADRDLRASGIDVTFFGEVTKMPPGPALLALQSGAALHPVSIRYERRGPGAAGFGIIIDFLDEVPVPASGTTRERVETMTAAVAGALEAAVAAAPEDWHMVSRLWLVDLGERGPR